MNFESGGTVDRPTPAEPTPPDPSTSDPARSSADRSAPESRTGPPSEARRLRRWVAQRKQWTDAERARLEQVLAERRQTSSVIGAGFDIRELDVHVGGGILAGAVAFRMFLFLVPYVYIVFTLLELVARSLHEDPVQTARTVGITGVLASAVVDTQHISLFSQVALLAGASVALILTANSLTKTLFVVHWLVWRVGRPRPAGLRALGVTVAIALVMTTLGAASNLLRARTGLAGTVLVVLIITAGSFAVWWWVSWRLPHAPMAPRDLVPGAVFVAVGADLMHALTVYWIGPLVARKSTTYGAVGIALAVLFWVYVFGRIIVGSAGVNVTLWRRGGGVVPEGHAPP